MQTQFQLSSYIRACTNEKHSNKSTRLNPYFGWFVLLIFIHAKVGINTGKTIHKCSAVHTMNANQINCTHDTHSSPPEHLNNAHLGIN